MDVLAYHLTQAGTTAYDSYNDPDSKYVYNGTTMRPPGYGYDYERPLDIEDKPYAHLISVDVTPIWVQFEDTAKPTTAAEYTPGKTWAYVRFRPCDVLLFCPPPATSTPE